MALGVGAFTSGVFHVVTHAFFKACLFLGSGSVIHAMHGEQDIRNMGGLKKWMPVTFWTFLISALAISGVFPFSGFFSKDEILAAAFEHSTILWAIGSLASLLTAFYMFRLVYLTFTCEFRGTEEQKSHLHESPILITLPLVVLAILAGVGGVLGLPAVFSSQHFLKNFLSPVFVPLKDNAIGALSHSTELALMAGAFAGALLSIAYAYMKYVSGKSMPAKEGEETGIGKLIYHKYYVDEIYNFLFVKPLMTLSDVFYSLVDNTIIDGIVNLSGRLSMAVGQQVRKLQSGYIGFYLIAMVLSIVVMFVWAFMFNK
jgi:NADH-quinone oxidoreductase subunit L